jgi:hypothetical protein
MTCTLLGRRNRFKLGCCRDRLEEIFDEFDGLLYQEAH